MMQDMNSNLVTELEQVVGFDELHYLAVEKQTHLLEILNASVESLNKNVLALLDTRRNGVSLHVFGVEIVSAGTPVRGPDVPLEDGTIVLIRLRPDPDNVIIGYFSGTQHGVRDKLQRHAFEEGDSINSIVNNLDLLFFDADTSGAFFEVSYEKKAPTGVDG